MEQWIVFNNGERGIMKGMVVYADSMDDANQKANRIYHQSRLTKYRKL
jgi:hypothetical protein